MEHYLNCLCSSSSHLDLDKSQQFHFASIHDELFVLTHFPSVYKSNRLNVEVREIGGEAIEWK